MSEFEDLLQERLERLEAGEPLAACLEGLSEEETGLLKMAVSLREMAVPQANPAAVARQRAQLLQNVEKESSMSENNNKVPFLTWLRSVLTTVPGAAVALATLVFIVWLSFSLFKPNAPLETETAVNPSTSITEPTANVTTPLEAAEANDEIVEAEPEESVAEVAETTDETAVAAAPAPSQQPIHMAYFPMLEVSPFVNARTAIIQEPVGLVEVQDKAGSWQVAKLGTTLEAGQRVRTGSLSSAKLFFYDGSQTTVSANSELSLDQLNAQAPQDGFRTIVMTQWLGQSEHHVAFRGDNGSRYEVNTPNGSGVARGTIFQVLVTADLLTHYTVIEGRVDVTNINVTVVVVAGQITIINPNQPPSPPYFSVSGQGAVTAIGETWTIGGQNFATTGTTLTIGNPQIGDIVHVIGYMQPDGSLVATVITLLHHDITNQFTLTGEATAIDADAWVVAGQTISITTETLIDEAIVLGDTVRVQGIILPDGTLVANSIDLVDNSYSFAFVGIVGTITADSWTISGVEISVNEATEIEGEIEVGDVVHVQGVILEDGTWLAEAIEQVEEESDFEFTGTVNGIAPWIVSGIGFTVDEFTQIDAGIVLGSLVHVQGQILADGTWLATAISLVEEDEQITVTFVGTVDSIDPWIVSGITLATDEATIIEEGIVLSDTVRVTAVILPDGTFLALTIQLIEDNFPVGCFTVAATIIGINGNVITLEGLPAITLDDDITVEGDLAVNTIIIITLCVGEDGTLTIINIIVIYVLPAPTPPSLPPTGGNDGGNGGGRVTLCHKGRKSLTVSQSALGGHLGHGDTVGSCN